jgi:methylmalonyl-CoA/ethylmalonyl-CoA epimerase
MSAEIISHIGIAVRDLEAAIATYSLVTGRKVDMITEVPDQKVRVAIIGGTGDAGSHAARIELVAATSPDSPIARFIEKRGEGLHHICLYVEDIEQKLEELKASGIRLIDSTPRLGAEGEKIAFVHPAGMNGVLLELHQKVS